MPPKGPRGSRRGGGGRKAGKSRQTEEETQQPSTSTEREAEEQAAGAPVDRIESPEPPLSPTPSDRSAWSDRRRDDQAAAAPKRKRADPVTTLEPFKTTEQKEQFIEWWRGEPCLYDKKHDGYMRRDHKDSILKAKAESLSISVDKLLKFQKHLRDAYNKVSKTVDVHTRSGAGQVNLKDFLSSHEIWINTSMAWIKQHLYHHQGQSVGVSKIGILIIKFFIYSCEDLM
jgi:DNA polymerase III gamma/tau subunit